MVLLSSVAKADTFGNDFDSMTVGQNICNAGFSALSADPCTDMLVSASSSYSSPYALKSKVNISGLSVFGVTASSTQGAFDAQLMDNYTGNSDRVGIFFGNGNSDNDDDATVWLLGGNVYYNLPNGADVIIGTYSASDWMNAIIEWRISSGFFQVRITVAGVGTTGFLTTDIPSASSSAMYAGVIVNSTATASRNNFIDNVAMITDGDYNGFDTEIDTGVTSEYDTRFVDASAATSTVTAQYFLQLSEVDVNNPARNPDRVQLRYSLGTSTVLYGIDNDISLTQGTSTTDFDLSSLSDGTYDVQIRFFNLGCTISGICPFDKTYLYFRVVMSGGVIVSMTAVEKYNTDTYNEITTEQPCSITQIQGCIQNTARYLLVPTSAQLENFNQFQEEVPNRVPFNWYYEISEAITTTEMASTSFPEYTLDLPLVGNDFVILSQDTFDDFVGSEALALFRTIMEIALWISFLIMVFFTIQGIFNKTDEGLKN